MIWIFNRFREILKVPKKKRQPSFIGFYKNGDLEGFKTNYKINTVIN